MNYLFRLILYTCALASAGPLATAQSPFKAEIRVPVILVRIKNPPPVKPTRSTVPVPERIKSFPGKTYADEIYISSFEAALANGNEALTAGDADDALGYFEQAGNLTADDPRPFVGVGAALSKTKQFGEAQAKFELAEKRFKAIKDGAGPSAGQVLDAEQIYRGLGYTALAAGNYQTSLNAYLNVHQAAGPEAVTLYSNMGVGLVHTHDFNGAESNFKHALALDPKAQDVRLNLGLLYVAMNDRENASTILHDLDGRDAYRAGLLRREIESMPAQRED